MHMGEKAREGGQRDRHQGTPKLASKAPEARREVAADFPSQPLEGIGSVDTLIWDF